MISQKLTTKASEHYSKNNNNSNSSSFEAKSNNPFNHTYNKRNNNNNSSQFLNTIGEILKLVKSTNENKEQSQSIYEDSYINNNINEFCSMMKTN